MHRRDFLTASTVAALGIFAARESRAAEIGERQIIDLRIYHFASPEKQQAYEKFLADAAIPAFARAGVGPVGAFKLLLKDNKNLTLDDGSKLQADSTDLYVLLTHSSPETVATLQTTLAADDEFQKAGKAILNAPFKDPAFTRYDSNLLLAFENCPTVQQVTKAPTRILQLRRYESHTQERALRKMHMFNDGGELTIFRRCGMNPVFFGESLAGLRLPNLTYMLGFDDEQAQKAGWGKFGQDPDWKKISRDPFYADTVSRITNIILRPVAGSQI